MSEPTVSIIIPCYNSAWTLPRLAKNLEEIIYPECEIIFVDDGSTDESAELFRKLVPNATILQQPNRGLSAARNAAARVARGEFLQMLDADDTLEPGKMQAQSAAACREQFDVAYSEFRVVVVRGEEMEWQPFQGGPPATEMVEALLVGWWAPPIAYLFRRQTYLDMGGCDETLKVWEDFDLFLRLALAGKKHGHVPGGFANYHRYLRMRSLSRRHPMEGVLCRERILRRTLDTLRARNELTPARKKAAAKAFEWAMRGAPVYDRAWLAGMLATIYELEPDFRPQGNWVYRTVARSAGIPTAERLAILSRPLRRRWRQLVPSKKGVSASEMAVGIVPDGAL